MGKEILTFGNIEIEKNKFFRNKIPFHLRDVDIEKVLVSSKISFGEKKTIYTLLVTRIMIKAIKVAFRIQIWKKNVLSK